jgi:competence protein ComEC
MIPKSPMFSYTVLYLAGILSANKLSLHLGYFVYSTILFLFVSAMLFFLNYRKHSYAVNTLLRCTIFMTFFLAGCWNICQSPYSPGNLYSSIPDHNSNDTLDLEVHESAKIKRKTTSLIANSMQYNERIILYTMQDGLLERYKPGERFKAVINPIPVSATGEYGDYGKYLHSKRCFKYAFVSESELLESDEQPNLFKLSIYNISNLLFEEIRKRSKGEEWGEIFFAIITGKKEELDSETSSAFKNAGALHIMAVSGLHVSLIYILIAKILMVFGNRLPMKIAKAVITIILVWSYCALSGFSSSSVRASIMITIMVVSGFFSGRYITANSLAVAALVITLYNPAALYSVGFQLSFAAMLSILFIAPYFDSLLLTKNRIIGYMYKTVTLSLSCQLGTALIAIPAFGELSMYFMISNLILMPLTAIVIFVAGFVAATGFSSLSANLGMYIIEKLVSIMYYTVCRIESLPMATVTINSKETQGWVVLVAIAILVSYTAYRGGLGERQSESRSD